MYTNSSTELAFVPHTLYLRDAKKPESLMFKSGDWAGCVTSSTKQPRPIPAVFRISGWLFPVLNGDPKIAAAFTRGGGDTMCRT